MDEPVEVGAGLHASRREAGLDSKRLLHSEDTRVLNHSHYIIVLIPVLWNRNRINPNFLP